MKRILYSTILIATILIGGVLAYTIWKASPVTSEQYMESAKRYYDQEKYSEATVEFLNAVQKDPKNRDARYRLALTYAKQQNLVSAARQLIALLEYFPDDVEANLQLGNIYLTGGRSDQNLFQQAAEMAQRILQREPQNVAALILSGNAKAGLQDYKTSVELFEKAIGLDPTDASAYLSLGTTQMLQKQYPEAEEAFLKARKASPKDTGALISLANYYRAVREPGKAEELFKELLSMDSSGGRATYLQVVEFYHQAGRLKEAENVLRDAQAKSAGDPTPSLILADLYIANNREADAKKTTSWAKREVS